MEGTKYLTEEAIIERGKEIKGIPLGLVDKTGRLATGKGAVGTVIEESWFGYKPNSEAEPDFPEAGVELKATPYIHTEHGIRAKERLVCNIIDYMQEYDKTFDTSAFWHKCKAMLLMSYEYIKGRAKTDITIDEVVLFKFPEEDLEIIKRDWEIIRSKIAAGKAHEISEGDTMYLAACTKGANASSVRKQPLSDIPAKQRAYSLKSSYMTSVLNRFIFGSEQNERIVKDVHKLKEKSFEDILVERLTPYFGKTQEELKKLFGVESTAKNLNELLLAKMLGLKGKLAYTDEFVKANIVPKTINVNPNGSVTESMSFPTFDFIELDNAGRYGWEQSTLYNYLAPTRFFFIIFQKNDNGESVFERVKFWNIPNDDLDEVGRVWKRTVDTIHKGVTITKTPRGYSNDLPKKSESRVAHVRPHGKDSRDTLPLPTGGQLTKQCFWLNNTYIAEQISKGSE